MNVDEPSEIELTPAASERLDHSLSLVRRQVLRELSRQHGDPGYRARVSDIDSVVKDIRPFSSSLRTANLLLLLTAILASIGLSLTLLIEIHSGWKSNGWLLGGLSGIAGATVGVLAANVVLERNNRRSNQSRTQQEFIRLFATLEEDIRRHAGELLGSIAENASLGRVISAVELLQLWTPDDSRAFRQLLNIRNSIVHEDSFHISRQRLASGFAQMARLSSLLDLDRPPDIKSPFGRSASVVRSSRVFEERIATALQNEGLNVRASQGDSYYDLIVSEADAVTMVVIKFRKAGILTVKDVADVVDRAEPYTVTVIVTNVTVSPYVYEYVQLAQPDRGRPSIVKVATWQDEGDSAALADAIRPDSSPVGSHR